jgi:hypothetical protein
MDLAIQAYHTLPVIAPESYPSQDVGCDGGIEQDLDYGPSGIPMDPACEFSGNKVTHLNPSWYRVIFNRLRN